MYEPDSTKPVDSSNFQSIDPQKDRDMIFSEENTSMLMIYHVLKNVAQHLTNPPAKKIQASAHKMPQNVQDVAKNVKKVSAAHFPNAGGPPKKPH